MKTQMRTTAKRGSRGPLADEGGFLLVMVMVVMLVLSTIAASTLINSFLERSLAKNQNYASIALQAADGGLAAGMSYIRENASNSALIPGASPWADIGGGVWPRTLTRTLPSGGSYTVTLRFKTEWRDINGDGLCGKDAAGNLVTSELSGFWDDAGEAGGDLNIGTADDPVHNCADAEIVLYNSCATGTHQCFGFPDALFSTAGSGFPIIEIDSVGTYGSRSYRQIAMDVARNRIDIQAEGAITARGPVTVSGSGYADGHNFNLAGTGPSASCPDAPAVTVDAGLTAPTAADPPGPDDCADIPGGNAKGAYGAAGNCTAVYDPTAAGNRPLETTPWGMLGIDAATFGTLFDEKTDAASFTGTEANPTYVWQQGDMHITGGSGFGILVVHNANYNPDVYEVSKPGSPDYDTSHGSYKAEADSSSPSYDATFAPATLFMNGNSNYTGVIIADQMLRVNGTATTVGALLSLGGINVGGDVTGNWSAKYSCDAIDKALGGFGYGTKIAWHRLR